MSLNPETEKQVVWIDYTNYRGERSIRKILPIKMVFDSTLFHPEEQWFLVAQDIEKNADRTFAVKDIHRWSPEPIS